MKKTDYLTIITGCQRTGTSVLSNYLRQLGYDLGTNFWHEEINGGLESPDICKFYQKELHDPDFPFNDFDEAIEKRKYFHISHLEKQYEVQKFSFLLMSPKFVEIWNKYRKGKNDKFVILRRSAEEVWKSKHATKKREKRFQGDHELLKQTPNELKQNIYDSLNVMLKYNMEFTMLKFPEFLKNYDIVWNALCKKGHLKIDYLQGKKVWNKVIDLDKVTSSSFLSKP